VAAADLGFDVTRNTLSSMYTGALESIYNKSIAESFDMALLQNTVVQRDVVVVVAGAIGWPQRCWDKCQVFAPLMESLMPVLIR
jgi:hypothetical protein